jgi:XisH protein
MPARDAFHETVKLALGREGWLNIAPITLRYGKTKLEVDLGAERFLIAQKGSIQIAVEVKSFAAASVVYEFHQAIGQYLHYRMVLKRSQPQRIPYMALPTEVYERSFQEEFFQDSVKENQVNLILVEASSKEISLWLPEPKS